MSNTICKIRLPSGNLAVFDVPPQHRRNSDNIREFGTHLFTKFGDIWRDVRAGYSPDVSESKSVALTALPIELDWIAGSWGIQRQWDAVDEDTVPRWYFVGPTGQEAYRFETEALAKEQMRVLAPRAAGRPLRVVRFCGPFDGPALRGQYYSKEGYPKRCMHCGCTELKTVVVDSIDLGVGGGGMPCAEEYVCSNCEELIGRWSFGICDARFEQTLPETLADLKA